MNAQKLIVVLTFLSVVCTVYANILDAGKDKIEDKVQEEVEEEIKEHGMKLIWKVIKSMAKRAVGK